MFAELADRMLANVTPENDYNALMADGRKDPKGLLKMWKVRPHEAARLPMIYLAAAEVTGEAKYREAYERYIDAALVESSTIDRLSEAELKATMPGYAFLQMAASLDLLYRADPDKDRQARLQAVGDAVGRLAGKRFADGKGADGPWLSEAGDLALARVLITHSQPEELMMSAYEKLFLDCYYGSDGQPPLWACPPARQLSFRAAEALWPIVAIEI